MSALEKFEEQLASDLHALERSERRRDLHLPTGVDFTSNDYLGLTTDHLLRHRVMHLYETELPLGSGGSRLLRGNHCWHEHAEVDFAAFQGVEASLYFSSGYAANMAVLTALTTRHDLILFDTMVHASIKEGIRASSAAKRSFGHNDVDSLRSCAEHANVKGNVFVIVESLYSMDGDEAPLTEIAAVCKAMGLLLLVDEAHATGLFGFNGRGIVDEAQVRKQLLASIHPCGKALAAAGAFVCASTTVIAYLLNRARTMIFTTALPPIVPATLSLVLKEIVSRPQLRERALANAHRVRTHLQQEVRTWRVTDGRSPIIPLIMGSDAVACAVARELQTCGLDVRPIRPPTVAEGTARFRITVKATHSTNELDRLCQALVITEKRLTA